jgi:SnoaL-like domain
MDDLEAIKQLKARYFRTMDTKDWAGMREVFADDVVVDTTDSGGGVITGPTSSWRSSVRRWPMW